MVERKVTEKELNQFNKKELIYCILHSSWLRDPLIVLYRNRVSNNYDEVDKLLEKNKELGKQLSDGMEFEEYARVYKQLHKNYKKIDKLYADNDKLDEAVRRL